MFKGKLQSLKIKSHRGELLLHYDINKSIKIAILNIKPATDVAGSDFGTWSLQVRVHNPNGTDDDNILEQWDGLTFDQKSSNYFAKKIGDRYVTIDSNGKLTYYGDYPNLSKHIRVGDFTKSGKEIYELYNVSTIMSDPYVVYL